jgi:Pyridoxamine 5'-phosphate oxidase
VHLYSFKMYQQGFTFSCSRLPYVPGRVRSITCGYFGPVCPRIGLPQVSLQSNLFLSDRQFVNRLRGSAVTAPSSDAVSKEGETAAITQNRPTSAETARTITELVNHGTLATVCEDGMPLGTYIAYVLLGGDGQPILRLRADAMHTANLLRDSRCSLFVVPSQRPASLLARVTLIGKVGLLYCK